MSVRDDFARWFYEDEAIRAGWSVRQLDRQIATQFFERTALSRNKEAMILKGRRPVTTGGRRGGGGRHECRRRADSPNDCAAGRGSA